LNLFEGFFCTKKAQEKTGLLLMVVSILAGEFKNVLKKQMFDSG